jgi:thioredoxin 1
MDVTNQEDARSIMSSSDVPVVVDFFAEWCGPCKMLSPVLESMVPEYDGKVKIIKVDIDQSQELSQEYGVTSVPTIAFIKGGQEVDRVVGFQSKDALAAKFDALAS